MSASATKLRVPGYELGELIGSGAMGAVFCGRRIADGRAVALKIVHPAYVGDANAMARFDSEAKAVAGVDHPNVIKVIDRTTASTGQPVLVLELVRGESLRARLDRCGKLNVRQSIRIGIKVACGIEAAHKKGIIHRDLKPENVMLEDRTRLDDEDVRLLDFGVAKLMDAEDQELTRAGMLVGTPDYMAPELIANPKAVTPLVDVYALGCLLFEMCTGSKPYTARGFEVLMHHVYEEPARASVMEPTVPPWLEQVILRAMSKDPAKRFQSMTEMATALLQRTSAPSWRDSTRKGRPALATSEKVQFGPEEELHRVPTHIGARPGMPQPIYGFGDEPDETQNPEPTFRVRPLRAPSSAPPRMRRIATIATMVACAALGSIGVSSSLFGRLLQRPIEAQRLTIDTNPSGADVYENGARIGHTPLILIGDGSARVHPMRFEKPGYAALSVMLAEAGNASATFQLSPLPPSSPAAEATPIAPEKALAALSPAPRRRPEPPAAPLDASPSASSIDARGALTQKQPRRAEPRQLPDDKDGLIEVRF